MDFAKKRRWKDRKHALPASAGGGVPMNGEAAASSAKAGGPKKSLDLERDDRRVWRGLLSRPYERTVSDICRAASQKVSAVPWVTGAGWSPNGKGAKCPFHPLVVVSRWAAHSKNPQTAFRQKAGRALLRHLT